MCHFPDGTLDGLVDIYVYGCHDSLANGYEKVPERGCAEASTSFDFNKWGVYLDTAFTSHKGSVCTSNEPASNHLNSRLTKIIFLIHLIIVW